jgi:hypothetical protein
VLGISVMIFGRKKTVFVITVSRNWRHEENASFCRCGVVRPSAFVSQVIFFVSDNLEGPNTPVASRAETPCDARSPAAPGKQRCTPLSSCSASGGRQRRSQKRCRVHRPDDFLKVNNKLLFIIKSTPQHNKTGGFSAGFAL